MLQVQKAILVVNLLKENARSVAEEIRAELESRGTAVTVFAVNEQPGAIPDGPWDIAFSLGGDGTVLYTARNFAPAGTPILPIHLGTLGFLAGVERHEWLAVYERWLSDQAQISSRCMLLVCVERSVSAKAVFGPESIVCTYTCLNDTVISSAGKARLIRLRLTTELASGGCADLGRYRRDGLIMATPTGSTAYSMAAGGPILDPEMEAVVVSPVCPFTLSNRPLVLPSRQTLRVTVEKEQRSGVILTIDGQDAFELKPCDTVIIKHLPHYARLITAGRSSYYSALKEKFRWGTANPEGLAYA
jgi:NAD+ kinase